MALRLATNREMESIPVGIENAVEVLATGGRLVVISFHSLEDRLVKNAFRTLSREGSSGTAPSCRLVTAHPVRATRKEQRENPRSRSAKMRVLERVTAARPTSEVTHVL
jgi:16S rRNA (cytosine1402-N4)-methyltransferase